MSPAIDDVIKSSRHRIIQGNLLWDEDTLPRGADRHVIIAMETWINSGEESRPTNWVQMAARDRQIRFNAVFTANTRSRFFSWQRGGTVHNKWGERGWVEYIFPPFPSVHREDDERMSEQPSFIYSPRCFPNSAVRYSSSCVVGCAAIKQPPLSLSCPVLPLSTADMGANWWLTMNFHSYSWLHEKSVE